MTTTTTSPTPGQTSRSGPRRGADVLVDCLAAAGIEHVFGVPGDTGVVFYDALFHQTDRVTHVLARDERHAVAMADAYARIANAVSAVEVSSGGGTTYAVGGLGEAFASGVPILLITSDIHSSSRGSGALTEIDQRALFSAVTKGQYVVEDAAEIPALVAEALETATSGRPGPVVVIVPEDMLDATPPVDDHAIEALRDATPLPRRRVRGETDAVSRAATALGRAEKPAILVGSGVHLSGAYEELRRLAERAGAAIATTIHGKGTIPDAHPWSVGVVGNNGAREYANDYLADADAVLLVGTRANATDTNSWAGPARDGSTAVIQIDVDPDRVGNNYADAIRLVGDAKEILGQLAEIVPEVTAAAAEPRVAEIAAARDRWVAGWEGGTPGGTAKIAPGQLLPREVVQLANELLPDDSVVVADPGTPTPNVSTYWDVASAGRTVIVPRGHGPMGYAIPAAVGACFARPGEPVLSLTADGSFAMACGELETVARFALPICYIQFTNNSLGWIKMLQHLYEGQRYFGVDPGPTDAVMVAEANGLEARRVTTLEELRELLTSFAADPRPLYIDVDVPHMIDFTPPVPAWIGALQGDSTRPVY